jgi:transketolase
MAPIAITRMSSQVARDSVLMINAIRALAKDGIVARVVSMSSATVFHRQAVDYKSSVLPPAYRASPLRPV